MFLREFVVRKHERGLLLRDGDFVRFLAPAVYRFFDPRQRLAVERFDLSQPCFEHPLSDYLVRWQPEAVEDLFLCVETSADQVALVTKNGHPWRVVCPAQRALFWKGVVRVKAELIDISTELALESRLTRLLAADAGARGGFDGAVLLAKVPEAHVGLLYVDGALVRELLPGMHAFWNVGRRAHVELVDLRRQELAITCHELLTNDRLEVSIVVHAQYRVAAPSLTLRATRDAHVVLCETLRRAMQAIVAARPLQQLLDDRDGADALAFERTRERLAPIGIELCDLHVDDVSVDDDLVALRLRKLDAIERLTEKVSHVAVFADFDGALGELIRLKL